MSLFEFLFGKKTNHIEENVKSVNEAEEFENKLLEKYGNCKLYQNFNLRLLFITDTHNCLAYKDKYLNYLKSINSSDYDICLLLGDFSGLDLYEIKNIIPNEKMYGIVGNHDSIDLLEKNGIKNINGNVITYKGIKIAAIMGSNRYKEGNYGMQTQEESLELAEKMEEADILISHDRAYIYDSKDNVHDGLKGITDYIYKNHVPIHIHGHFHEEMEEILKNGTKSIGLYQIKLLEI